MPKAKKELKVETSLTTAKEARYSPTQSQGLTKLKDRLTEKNRFKLQQSKGADKIEPAGDDYDLTQVQAMEATGMVDPDASSRLLTQVIVAQPNSESLINANAAVAMLQGIGPQDELEGMLAAQMVAIHNLSLEYARRVMGKDVNRDQAESLISRTTKLMNVFTRQVEALNKYRNRGQQKITVQHVQVSEGGQAIIGDVHQGGGQRG